MHRITTAGLDTIPKDSEWVELMWQLGEATLLLADREVAEEIRGRLAPYAHQWAVDGMAGACFGRVADLLARLDELLERPESGAAPQHPQSAEFAKLRREGRVWQVAFRGRQATIPHSKGMADLATLVARPGREVHVLDLVEAGGGPSRAEAGGSTGPVLDHQARASYRARLVDLEDEIDAASGDADTGRVDTLVAERDFLLAELGAAIGLSGRDRVAGDRAERARKAVTMRIATAQKAIAEAHPGLAQHLRLSVFTGRFCCYRPERPVIWRT